ncbi:MAG TPA: PDZ domain-containing protein [candidate division Zixibacteria bacterium]|nr:PDZ domain-containing protein [candidate division Zixibacteria bacterium]MDD4918983.1 PDZ domain-containing protein [candidate division Zixibacteria bacterium]MDM7972920.1 PDZ domain-containing protein [candidate division Zixibacteria bacterium]HOD67794.1 PDZ domain-containing protein [candidate division Zixibacteria bacterium]HOZ08333.1 PDZ domain-containing protein [candidate division Zixibacteria bacterium]
MKRFWLAAIVALAALGLLAATGLAGKDTDERAWLGVYTQSVDYDLADAFDLTVSYGAVINEVVEDSPADQAGLKNGDVIISLNGEKITDSDDLIDVLHEASPGDRLELVVIRDGKEQSVSVVAGARSEEDDNLYGTFRSYFDGGNHSAYTLSGAKQTYLGITLNDLTDQLGGYFGVADGKGALVSEVAEDSPAERAGLKAGDVVIEIDGEKVADASEVTEAIRDREAGDKVVITAIRNQRAENFTAELETRDSPFYGNFATIGPDLAILNVPKLRGLSKGNYDGALEEYFNSEEFQREMKELQEQLGKLKFEFKDLDRLGDDRDELRKELEELRRELQEMKAELKRELRDRQDRQ